MSLPELARALGVVSVSCLRTWAKSDPPLRGTETPSGQTLYTWAQLRAFCVLHPERPKARAVTAWFAARDHGEAASGTPTANPDPASTRSPQPHDGAADPQQVRAILGDLRAAADYTVNAVLSAARSAEHTATAHREQIEALAAAIRSYDDLLTQLTAPVSPHD